MGTGEAQKALEQAMARWEVGFGRSRLGESGMRRGKGVLIYLLLCIHLKFQLPSKKRAHSEAHPMRKPCAFPGRPSPYAAHSFHVPHPGSTNDNAFWRDSQAQWLGSLEHITKPLQVSKSSDDNIFMCLAFLWGEGELTFPDYLLCAGSPPICHPAALEVRTSTLQSGN